VAKPGIEGETASALNAVMGPWRCPRPIRVKEKNQPEKYESANQKVMIIWGETGNLSRKCGEEKAAEVPFRENIKGSKKNHPFLWLETRKKQGDSGKKGQTIRTTFKDAKTGKRRRRASKLTEEKSGKKPGD